ncbi:MAG: MFS transporter [Sphingobium sp.]
MASHAGSGVPDQLSASLIAALEHWRQVMVVLACFTATLCTALIYDVLPPIMTNLASHFGGGAQGALLAQLAGTVPLFGVMVGGVVAGPAIEKIGLRAVLICAMALFGLAGSAGAMLDAPWPFLAARLMMGAAGRADCDGCARCFRSSHAALPGSSSC